MIKASPPRTPPTIAPVLLTEDVGVSEGVLRIVEDDASDVADDAVDAVELSVPVEEGELIDGVASVDSEELDDVEAAEGVVAASNK